MEDFPENKFVGFFWGGGQGRTRTGLSRRFGSFKIAQFSNIVVSLSPKVADQHHSLSVDTSGTDDLIRKPCLIPENNILTIS